MNRIVKSIGLIIILLFVECSNEKSDPFDPNDFFIENVSVRVFLNNSLDFDIILRNISNKALGKPYVYIKCYDVNDKEVGSSISEPSETSISPKGVKAITVSVNLISYTYYKEVNKAVITPYCNSGQGQVYTTTWTWK